MDFQEELLAINNSLFSYFGHQGWWPADTSFGAIIGVILTQNVAWRNARKAVDNLKDAGLPDPEKLYAASADESPLWSRRRVSTT